MREDADPIARRQALMAVCADATLVELDAALAALAPLPAVEDIRAPEIGMVMVRGRIGGDGAPFNAGEATMTRAAVKSGGYVGHGHVLGRVPEKARAAAIIDALGQGGAHDAAIRRHLIEPVTARRDAERTQQAAETAATKVDFFTMVRGDA